MLVGNAKLVRQQSVLASFGKLALTSTNLDEVLTHACRLVEEGLGADSATLLELQEDGDTLIPRAGGPASQDMRNGTCLSYAAFQQDISVPSSRNVVIRGQTPHPFGVLQVASREPNNFTEDDAKFLDNYAQLIAGAVERCKSAAAMAQSSAALEAQVEARTTELTQANLALRAANDALEAEAVNRANFEAVLLHKSQIEAIGQLSGGIAHDFNNMLQLIGAGIELAQFHAARGHPEETARHLDTVRQTVIRAATLTNQLLAFGRRQPLQPRVARIDDLVVKIEELLRRTLSSARAAIALQVKLDNHNWMVLYDPNQLESALLNITINARDAMPEGGNLVITTREISLTAADLAGHPGVQPGEFVEIIVADDGVGMDEVTRRRVFEPFFTTKPTGKGTGLGLSQAHGFVHQSGGLITLRSELGIGTEVHLYLRRAAMKAGKAKPEEASPSVHGYGRLLLLVEDDVIERKCAAEFLSLYGYDVLEAEDGPAALKIFNESPEVDFLITDVGLPNGMNGRQLAEIMRRTSPALPVLFISGYAGAADIAELDPGMQLIQKPFPLRKLAANVADRLRIPKQSGP